MLFIYSIGFIIYRLIGEGALASIFWPITLFFDLATGWKYSK